jgi:hypothetical protein
MKENVLGLLKAGIVNIKFTKRDGSIRLMRATLVPELIGIHSFSKAAGPEHTQSVWDLEKGEWRSFRWDSLIESKLDAS